MFKCKVCQEKDARIHDLLAEISYLRNLANPSALTVQLPQINEEANRILSGTQESNTNYEATEELEAIEAERLRLLTGNY